MDEEKEWTVPMSSIREFTVTVKAKTTEEAEDKAMDPDEWEDEETIEDHNLQIEGEPEEC